MKDNLIRFPTERIIPSPQEVRDALVTDDQILSELARLGIERARIDAKIDHWIGRSAIVGARHSELYVQALRRDLEIPGDDEDFEPMTIIVPLDDGPEGA